MKEHKIKSVIPDNPYTYIPRPTGLTEFRIGLELLGAPYKPDVQTSHQFTIPNYGPPREVFWFSSDGNVTEEMFVINVESPQKFWLQNTKKKAELDALVEEMTEWYDNHWTYHPPLSKCRIIVGGFYAAYSDEYQKWYRVRILEYVMGGKEPEYLVQQLDFSSWSIVSRDYIYPLRQPYIKLPIQAVQASLYDESSLATFSLTESEKFRNEIGGKGLGVLAVDEVTEPDNVFPILQVIFATKPHDPKADYTTIFETFYTLDGRIKFDSLLMHLVQLENPM